MAAIKTRERPILFSGPMVRAILDGSKTQTRRVFRLPEGWTHDDDDLERIHILLREGALKWAYGTTGERLWVRETHQAFWVDDLHPDLDYVESMGVGWRTTYPATDGLEEMHIEGKGVGTWCRPSIFMPRWASRILLDVVDVHIERLNDISEEDARAEGVDPSPGWPVDGKYQYVEGFRNLWDRINGKRATWESSPWVWVVSFKVSGL